MWAAAWPWPCIGIHAPGGLPQRSTPSTGPALESEMPLDGGPARLQLWGIEGSGTASPRSGPCRRIHSGLPCGLPAGASSGALRHPSAGVMGRLWCPSLPDRAGNSQHPRKPACAPPTLSCIDYVPGCSTARTPRARLLETWCPCRSGSSRLAPALDDRSPHCPRQDSWHEAACPLMIQLHHFQPAHSCLGPDLEPRLKQATSRFRRQ